MLPAEAELPLLTSSGQLTPAAYPTMGPQTGLKEDVLMRLMEGQQDAELPGLAMKVNVLSKEGH